MITYKDCPECGARKIHSTVRLCEVCETCEKYESRLAGEAAHIESLEGLLVDAVRERDEARAEVERLRERVKRLEAEVAMYRAGQQTLAGMTGGVAWR